MINLLLLEKLWPIDIAFVMLVAFSVYVFIRTPGSYGLKWALIPASLMTAIFSFTLFGQILGTSYPIDTPPDSFTFLAYYTIVKGDKPVALEVWIKAKPTRLIRIPYTKFLEDKMKEAAKAKSHGNTISFHRSKMSAGNDYGADGGWAMDIMNPITLAPKDPENAKSQ